MYQNFIKRCLDIIFSLIAIPFVTIVTIVVTIAIKIDDHGSVFYSSTRLGENMKEFQMYKFRSMVEYAPDIRNDDGTTYNSENDSRVTRVGRVLRKTSIDELPQIFNVLIGNMSFIGPRPSPTGDKSAYTDDFFVKFDVLPGITGYSQAKVRNNATIKKRIQLDKYYVNNISFKLDLKVLFYTVNTVLFSKNINRN